MCAVSVSSCTFPMNNVNINSGNLHYYFFSGRLVESETLIKRIIKENNVITVFQPVVSLKEMRIIGFEALSRGICSDTGAVINPLDLFDMARAEKCELDLDRLCRRTAMKSFKAIPDHDKYLLFLNLDTSVLDNVDPTTAAYTKDLTDSFGLKYSSISLEIVESKVENSQNLIHFIDNYRKLGFYVSLDDFGAMHSNMDRIILSKPDIIKIDMELIRNIHNNYYQQSIITSIIDIARKTGALTLAEGLENMDDIMKSYELGIDLYQGFFLHRPCADITSSIAFIQDKIDYTVQFVKNRLQENVTHRKNKYTGFENLTNLLIKESVNRSVENFYKAMKANISFYPEIERIFILDNEGIQAMPSIVNGKHKSEKSKSFNMFHENHSDHSLKDYFYYLKKLNTNKYFTDTFISTSSGNILRTMSCNIDIQGSLYILCIDFIDTIRS